MITIIISALAGSLILLYCLSGKKTKKTAISVAFGFAVIMVVLAKNAENHETPVVLNNPQVRTALAAELKNDKSFETPLEVIGGILMITAWAVILGAVFVGENLDEAGEDKKYIRQIYWKCLCFIAAVTAYLLSLNLGLELNFIPWIKLKDLPVLRKQTVEC